jgi:hypothetical protein
MMLALVVVSSLAEPAAAATGNPMAPEHPDQWRFTLAFPMLWAPDVNVKIRGDRREDIEISFQDILEGLDFGLMGEFYATRGPFGLAARFNYLDLRSEQSREGLVVDTELKMKLTAGVSDFLASWRSHDRVRLLTGVRHVHSKVRLYITSIINGNEISNERIPVSDEDSFDMLFGFSYDQWFSERWGLIINGDVGLFGDNDRNFSAEFRGIYRFGKLNNVWFGYRYLRIGNDTEEDGLSYELDTTQHGPMAGWAFTF